MTKTSELADALIKAQGEMGVAVFDSENPHFRSKFASLSAVRKATLPALHKHGFAILQPTCVVDGQFGVKTVLLHSSGESIEGFFPVTLDANPQKMGSAVSYGRRYGWAAICGIVSDVDDDGEAAVERQKPQQPAKPTPSKDRAEEKTQEIIDVVSVAPSAEAIQIYEKQQLQALQWLDKRKPELRERIRKAVNKRLDELAQPAGANGVNSEDIPY